MSLSDIIGFGKPYVVAIWIAYIVIFLLWYINEMRHRRYLTMLSCILFLFFFIPVIIQYPFVFSPINMAAVGLEGFDRYEPDIDYVFLICLVGIISFLIGYNITKKSNRIFLPAKFVADAIKVWISPLFIFISSILIILLFLVLFKEGMVGGEGMRAASMENPLLRPLANYLFAVLPIIITLMLLSLAHKWDLVILITLPAIFILSILSGSRSIAFGGVVNYVLIDIIYKSIYKKISAGYIIKIVLFGVFLVILILYLGNVREGRYEIKDTILNIGVALFYGSNFSDLRDFAWIYSSWDKNLLLGKTQLAGMMAFIPSKFSSFRTEWNVGIFTSKTVGVDPDVHPGLRSTIFGESYFNFGIIGVIVAGLLLGYLIKRLDEFILVSAKHSNEYDCRNYIFSALVTFYLFAVFFNTAGFYGFYALLANLVVLNVCYQAVHTFKTSYGRRAKSLTNNH